MAKRRAMRKPAAKKTLGQKIVDALTGDKATNTENQEECDIALGIFQEEKDWRDALRRFLVQMDGKIEILYWVPVFGNDDIKTGISENISIKFKDKTGVRLIRYINNISGKTNVSINKVEF